MSKKLREGDLIDDDALEIDDTPEAGPTDVKALAEAIVAATQANQAPRQITYEEYLQKVDTHRHKPQLTRVCYQNGIRLHRDQLTVDAINLLNMLRPGVYCGHRFVVAATQDGVTMSALDIRYNNKSVDERMQLKSEFPTFEHMLAAMVKEQSALVTA